jgi:enoyl-CoA hydratase/carnithine racemase
MILMAGQKIEAPDALSWGLIDRVVEAEALATTAQALAADSLAATPEHAAAIKRMIWA